MSLVVVDANVCWMSVSRNMISAVLEASQQFVLYVWHLTSFNIIGATHIGRITEVIPYVEPGE